MGEANAAERSLVQQLEKTTAGARFYRHFGDDGHPHSSSHHGKNRREMPALENYPGTQTSAPACGHRSLAETVTVFKQQEWIVVNLAQGDGRLLRKPVLLREHNEQRLARLFHSDKFVTMYVESNQCK